MKFVSVKKSKTSYLLLILIFGLFFYTISNLFILNNTAPLPAGPTPTIAPEVKSATVQPLPSVSSSENNEDIIFPWKEFAKVIKIIDGDTIEVDFGQGMIKTVRYIGIDTPETVDPRKSVQCFGKEASDKNKSLVLGKTVGLDKDVSETDKYGRLLRYVYIDEGMVNQLLIEEGFAYSSAYPPDIRHQDILNVSEEQARGANKGLWGVCGQNTDRIERKSSDPLSDDKDCSDFRTHQEAQNYFESKGGSPSNNIDKLDGSDRDGQVCETLP